MDKVNWYRQGMSVLHFAPERIFRRLFSAFEDIDYWAVDLDPNRYAKIRRTVDITDIPFDDNSFDLIMCMHVLEHVPDDRKALRELHRVLKPKTGIAFLNVPISKQALENPEYNTPELRLKYYGHKDHVRRYSYDSYLQRLIEAGFTDIQVFSSEGTKEEIIKRYGLRKDGKTFLCRKE